MPFTFSQPLTAKIKEAVAKQLNLSLASDSQKSAPTQALPPIKITQIASPPLRPFLPHQVSCSEDIIRAADVVVPEPETDNYQNQEVPVQLHRVPPQPLLITIPPITSECIQSVMKAMAPMEQVQAHPTEPSTSQAITKVPIVTVPTSAPHSAVLYKNTHSTTKSASNLENSIQRQSRELVENVSITVPSSTSISITSSTMASTVKTFSIASSSSSEAVTSTSAGHFILNTPESRVSSGQKLKHISNKKTALSESVPTPLSLVTTPRTTTPSQCTATPTVMSSTAITVTSSEIKMTDTKTKVTSPKEAATTGDLVPLVKGCKHRVSKQKLVSIYTPHPALYTVRLAELVFGKETLDHAAKSSRSNPTAFLDQSKLESFVSK